MSHPFNILIFESEWVHNYLTVFKSGRTVNLKTQKPQINKAESRNSRDIQNNRENVATVLQICNQFHKSYMALQKCNEDGSRFKIEDESNVKELLGIFLSQVIQDIRREEPTKSFGGKSARIDFLLKQEQIGIEVKYATEKRNEKVIGDELKVDIIDYKTNPECKVLICFIYDPENTIKKQAGLKNDLMSLSTNALAVIVVVNP